VPARRDLRAFEARAAGYEHGFLGRLHRQIDDRTIELLLASTSEPKKVLDIGCGTGYFLRSFAARIPNAVELVGVDPAAPMIDVATASSNDSRLSFLGRVGAEHLPFENGAFDAVTAINSFDHWADQRLGLTECWRVLRPGGRLVLVDLINLALAPTLVTTHRGKARTKRRLRRLLVGSGFDELQWHRLYSPWVKAVVARRRP
jgi:ubiquinone/menaquinone biosynthesis C-methylase UbiE